MNTPEEPNLTLDCPVRQMCSLYTQQQGEDPIGTGANWHRYLILEAPLPWPEDITRLRGLPADSLDVLRRAAAAKLPVRFLAIGHDREYSQPGHTRVLQLTRPKPPFARYNRAEFTLPVADLGGLLQALLFEPGKLADYSAARQDTSSVRDLLICTHGAVDACCGKFGYPLYQELRHRYDALGSDRLRVWRASHFGGHRFAPTILDLPEARFWAHVTPDKLDALVLHDRPFSELRLNYRGWGGIDRIAQLAERAVFEIEGWPWVDYLKSARVLEKAADGSHARVRIDYSTPDGGYGGSYEAHVELSGRLTHNHCLRDDKLFQVNQYTVTSLTHTARQPQLELPALLPAPALAS